MAKSPTIAQVRRTLRSFATTHRKLRAFYGKGLSNAKLLQIAQACVGKSKKAAPRKPRKVAVRAPVMTLVPPPVAAVPAPEPETVPRSKRPNLNRAVRIVMGDKIMTAKEVAEAVMARGWEPLSTDPYRFICQFVSSARIFQKIPAKGAQAYRVRAPYVLLSKAA